MEKEEERVGRWIVRLFGRSIGRKLVRFNIFFYFLLLSLRDEFYKGEERECRRESVLENCFYWIFWSNFDC